MMFLFTSKRFHGTKGLQITDRERRPTTLRGDQSAASTLHILQVPLRYKEISITDWSLNSRRRGHEETVLLANMLIDTSAYYSKSHQEDPFSIMSALFQSLGILASENHRWTQDRQQ